MDPLFLKDRKFLFIVILLPFSPGMEPIPEDMENESKTHCNKSIQWSIDE